MTSVTDSSTVSDPIFTDGDIEVDTFEDMIVLTQNMEGFGKEMVWMTVGQSKVLRKTLKRYEKAVEKYEY